MPETFECNNKFNFQYLRYILARAKENGYQFSTLREFYQYPLAPGKHFVFRLDLDVKPACLGPFIEVAREFDIPITVFVRVAGPYNIFWYPHFQQLQAAYEAGFEIGLHTTPVEWARINARDASDVLTGELSALRALFPVEGIAPHRDINYTHNSLPWIDDNIQTLKEKLAITYHAYEPKFLNNLTYVNEGLSPHLCWRSRSPEEVIEAGEPIYLLLHPHWWFMKHPFESD